MEEEGGLVAEGERTGVSSIHACPMNPFSACMEDRGTQQGTQVPAAQQGTASTPSLCRLSQCPPYLGQEGPDSWLRLYPQPSP